jgi:hypothetical protein
MSRSSSSIEASPLNRSLHRGEAYVESRLSSRLFGLLSTRLHISETHGETEIVETLAAVTHEEFPTWFGEELARFDGNTTDEHLSEAQLREAYFGEDLEPEPGLSIREDSVFSEIVEPFTQELLACVGEQQEADREAALQQGKRAVKRTIVEEVSGGALEIDDAQEAAAEALARLEERAERTS